MALLLRNRKTNGSGDWVPVPSDSERFLISVWDDAGSSDFDGATVTLEMRPEPGGPPISVDPDGVSHFVATTDAIDLVDFGTTALSIRMTVTNAGASTDINAVAIF
jgi:hypothetical protein